MSVNGTVGRLSIFSSVCSSNAELLKASIADVNGAARERRRLRGERRAEKEKEEIRGGRLRSFDGARVVYVHVEAVAQTAGGPFDKAPVLCASTATDGRVQDNDSSRRSPSPRLPPRAHPTVDVERRS